MRNKKNRILSATQLHQYYRVDLFGISISVALCAVIGNVCLPVQTVHNKFFEGCMRIAHSALTTMFD